MYMEKRRQRWIRSEKFLFWKGAMFFLHHWGSIAEKTRFMRGRKHGQRKKPESYFSGAHRKRKTEIVGFSSPSVKPEMRKTAFPSPIRQNAAFGLAIQHSFSTITVKLFHRRKMLGMISAPSLDKSTRDAFPRFPGPTLYINPFLRFLYKGLTG